MHPRYSSLIYPGGRWIHRSGKGLKNFGLDQINDSKLAKLIFYPNANVLFSDAGIADGISIVLKDRTKCSDTFTYIYDCQAPVECRYPKHEIFPLNPLDNIFKNNICKTILDHHWTVLHDSVLPRSLFSIESNYVEKNASLVSSYYEGKILQQDEIKLFTNDKAGKSGRATWYVTKRENIKSGIEYIDRWKVVVSSANAGGQKRSNQIAILDNKSAFGRSRIALKTFETETEAKNFLAYCKTNFIRFAFLLTDEALTSLAKLVPDIGNYKDDNGVIDFSKDLDEQLYCIFGIDESMKKHIENVLVCKKE